MLARASRGPRQGQNRAGSGSPGTFRNYTGSAGRYFGRAPPRARWFNFWTEQMEFTAIEQFPLHGFTRLQADGGGQGQREADVEARLLALGTTGLNFDGIGGLHFFSLIMLFLVALSKLE